MLLNVRSMYLRVDIESRAEISVQALSLSAELDVFGLEKWPGMDCDAG